MHGIDRCLCVNNQHAPGVTSLGMVEHWLPRETKWAERLADDFNTVNIHYRRARHVLLLVGSSEKEDPSA